MGEVYAATDFYLQREIALKLLPPHRISAENRRRMQREAFAMSRLQHPSITRIFSLEEGQDGALFLTMELLQGEDLKSRIKRQLLSPEELVLLGIQICEGLTAAHAAGIVHRDLKPANLFLSPASQALFQARVLDFGLAQLDDGDDNASLYTGAAVGTPSYMAPEQARGEERIDGRADLYSLGITLYECISGRLPFEADNRAALLLKLLREEPTPLQQHCPDLSPALLQVIHQAFARTPQDRFQDARSMLNALIACQGVPESLPSVSLPLIQVHRLREGQRRVAVFYAEGVLGQSLLSKARHLGGWAESLQGNRAIALFGLEGSFGEEAERAAKLALSSRNLFSLACIASAKVEITSDGPNLAPLLEAVFGLAAVCPEGEIAIDRHSVRQLQQNFVSSEEAEGLFLLRGQRALRPEEQAPMFGRDDELLSLQSHLKDAILRRPQSLLLVFGSSGMGKSRLCEEVILLLRSYAEECIWLHGRANPMHRNAPLSLFADLFRQLAELDENLSEEARQERLFAFLARFLPRTEVQRLFQPFCALLSLAALSPRSPTDSTRRPLRMEDAIRDFLRALSRLRTPILLFEDLDLADEASLALLDEFFARPLPFSLHMIGFTKPEGAPALQRLAARPECAHIVLSPLSAEAIFAICSSQLGHPPSRVLLDFICQRSLGNPLFVKEFLHALEESNLLSLHNGQYYLKNNAEALDLPANIEGVLQARLDQLPEEERQLLQQAAILGSEFRREVLDFLQIDALEPLLQNLLARELVVQNDNQSFAFRNEALREVAASLLSSNERRSLHANIAAWLSAQGAPEEKIAWHLAQSGERGTAASAYERAAQRAAAANATQEALQHYEEALALLAPLSIHNAGMMLSQIKLLLQLGQYTRARDVSQQLCHLSAENPYWSARAYLCLAEALHELQSYTDSQEARNVAVMLAQQAENIEVEVEVLLGAATLAEDLGERSYALACVERSLALLQSTPHLQASKIRAHRVFGRLLRRSGRIEEARQVLQEGLQSAEELGDRWAEAQLQNQLGILAHCQLLVDEALLRYQRAIGLAESVGAFSARGRWLGNLGQVYLSLNLLPDARSTLKQAIALARSTGDALGLADNLAFAALTDLARGETESAVARGEEALLAAQTLGQPYHLGHASCALGESLLQAKRDLHRVVQLAQSARDAGARGQLPDVSLRGLILSARVYAALGDSKAACGEAAAALRTAANQGPELHWILEAHLCYHDLFLPFDPQEAYLAISRAHQIVLQQTAQIQDDGLRESILRAPPQADILARISKHERR